MRISDWSSDVCSSDLQAQHLRCLGIDVLGPRMAGHVQGDAPLQAAEAVGEALLLGDVDHVFGDVVGVLGQLQIGRASCRERVWPYGLISVVAGSLKKKERILNMMSIIIM